MFPIPYTLERVYLFIRSKTPQRRVRSSDVIYAVLCIFLAGVIMFFACGIASGQIRVKVSQTSEQKQTQP